MTPDPLRIDGVPAALRRPIEWALAIPALRQLYAIVGDGGCANADACEAFERRVLRALDITLDVADQDVALIPRTGAVVVTANHPHGALDGLVLVDLIRRVRPDVRVVANRLLERIPELHGLCFSVDPFQGAEAAARSRAGLRAAHLWLRRGGALAVFPAGEVGYRWQRGTLVDSEWKATFERMAASTGAQVIPAFIEGRNSRLFYAAGRLHPALRTILLGRELMNKRGRVVPVRVGRQNEIACEIERLGADACLVDSGAFQVFCAGATDVPATLREIGRLREITYRAIGEGTGRALDLDRFDDHYLHLFVWNRERQEIVGAYRIGRTDRILAERGVDGLYTRTLFRYDHRLLARFDAPALELGRSFVRAEYQKNYNALLLLWRGIGQFVVRNPQYRLLFGPVSISARYSDASHALLMEFLRQNHLDRDLAGLVEAVNPVERSRPPELAERAPQGIDEVNRLVAAAEHDGKGVPVLLRQYLKLNAKLIAFNTDPAFGDALDALMVVDLANVGTSILNRYFGREDAAAFLAFHRGVRSKRAA